jgi:hypothetical protein
MMNAQLITTLRILSSRYIMSSAEVREIGCCGAYCRTCPSFIQNSPRGRKCRGCKLGYEEGTRDRNRIRCHIKSCCFIEGRYETCADCSDYSSCRTIKEFFLKHGSKYKQAVDFIRANGYPAFLAIAQHWKDSCEKF